MLPGVPQPLPRVTALLGDDVDTVEDYLLVPRHWPTSYRGPPLAERGHAGSFRDLLFVVRQFLDGFVAHRTSGRARRAPSTASRPSYGLILPCFKWCSV